MVRLTMENVGSEGREGSLAFTSTAGLGHERTPEPEPLALDGDIIFAPSSTSQEWGAEEGARLRELIDIGGEGALAAADGGVGYEVALAPGAEHSIVVKIPFVGRLSARGLGAAARALVRRGARAGRRLLARTASTRARRSRRPTRRSTTSTVRT